MLPPKRAAAFTLMELLITISLVILLVAILLPTFQTVRETGRRATCLSNMRQLATTLMLYSAEHNNRVIPVSSGASNQFNDRAWYYYLEDSGLLPAAPKATAAYGRVAS